MHFNWVICHVGTMISGLKGVWWDDAIDDWPTMADARSFARSQACKLKSYKVPRKRRCALLTNWARVTSPLGRCSIATQKIVLVRVLDVFVQRPARLIGFL